MTKHKQLFSLFAVLAAAFLFGSWLAMDRAPHAEPDMASAVASEHDAHDGHDHAHGPVARAPVPSDQPAAGSGPEVEIVPEEQYYPRDENEWQGLRVRSDSASPCDRKDGCNLGLACIAGTCKPCGSDSDCAQGEACTLDHCLPAEQVSCRSRTDCGQGELCFLSSYEGTTGRMNEGMHAYCSGIDGRNPFAHAEDPDVDYTQEVPGVQFSPQELGPSYELAASLREEARRLFGEPSEDANQAP